MNYKPLQQICVLSFVPKPQNPPVKAYLSSKLWRVKWYNQWGKNWMESGCWLLISHPLCNLWSMANVSYYSFAQIGFLPAAFGDLLIMTVLWKLHKIYVENSINSHSLCHLAEGERIRAIPSACLAGLTSYFHVFKMVSLRAWHQGCFWSSGKARLKYGVPWFVT